MSTIEDSGLTITRVENGFIVQNRTSRFNEGPFLGQTWVAEDVKALLKLCERFGNRELKVES